MSQPMAVLTAPFFEGIVRRTDGANARNAMSPAFPWADGDENAESFLTGIETATLTGQVKEPSPKLVGIARLAAEGESVREGHNVEYFTLGARSLLTRVVSRRKLPFAWSINPYRGCEFACKYCYARYTHEFMELRDGVDFERKIFVKQQAAALLRPELKKVKRGEEIAIGTATDPYQPAERRFEITRAILEELAAAFRPGDRNRDQVEPGDARCGDPAATARRTASL